MLAPTAMGCSAETQGNIAKIFSIAHPRPPQAKWADNIYTCTYHVPTGILRISVKQSSTDAAALSYFSSAQQHAAGARPVTGLANLGLPAYETADGQASFVKDNMTLLVDATHLAAPAAGAPSKSSIAFEIATAVLACWNS
ncbi:hypothetical protein [Curtobacterium sp. ISL-83]|uniref:hypothetical protein n=1 Tax=Curtobacterium sp. ISL-83 TaxID=2819145 RepID=UPI001BE4EE45|nr:hypothetical protein [Curtobacterium sp. ISL-83]MBT2504171.1 hypothetical protein [Curtobacterium sp. ISL-83]